MLTENIFVIRVKDDEGITKKYLNADLSPKLIEVDPTYKRSTGNIIDRVVENTDLFFSELYNVSVKYRNTEEYVTIRTIVNGIIDRLDFLYINNKNIKLAGMNIPSIINSIVTFINMYTEHNITGLPTPITSNWSDLGEDEDIEGNKIERLKPTNVFNLDSDEMHTEAKILGGNPDGLVNFNDTPHQFAVAKFKDMIARHWVVEQISLAQDIKAFANSPEWLKRSFVEVLSQLTLNDSYQTSQINRLTAYITSPVVVNMLTRQAFEECVHSQSYSRMIRDILNNDQGIFYLHREYINGKKNPDFSPQLYKKNTSIKNMYSKLYQAENPTKEDMLMIFVANQILEEMVFPGGFAFMLSLPDDYLGVKSQIEEIFKDRMVRAILAYYISRIARHKDLGI